MDLLTNLIGAYIFFGFVIAIIALDTKWFSTLPASKQTKLVLGWPIMLPYYLWLRYQDRNAS